MMGKTHMMAGAAGWLGAAALTGMPPAAAIGGTLVCTATALVPDIDAPKSDISLWFRPVTGPLSWLVRLACGARPRLRRKRNGHVHLSMTDVHRGPTHSLAGLLVWSVLVAALWLVPAPWWLPVAAMAGYADHLVMDALTIYGIPLLWAPWHRKPALVHLLPPELRVTTGGGRKRGRWRKSGAEYWLIRPLVVLVGVGSAVLVVRGH